MKLSFIRLLLKLGFSKLLKFSIALPCISSVIVLSRDTSKIGWQPKDTNKPFDFVSIRDIAVTGNFPFNEASNTLIKKLFSTISNEEDNYKIIKSKGKYFQSPHNITYLQQVNKYLQNILGYRYSSHSFRQGLITEMSTKGINTKIIKEYIGHSDIKTTLRYVKPSKVDIREALVR